MLTKGLVALAAPLMATPVLNGCPNENWEPLIDELNENGEPLCQPKADSYEIKCTPTGIEVDIKYGLLYDAFDAATIAQSLTDQPARLGNCFGYKPDESSLDYKFKVDFDQKNENGDYCYSEVLSGQKSNDEADEQTYINFVYEISGSDSATRNDLGMILSSKLSFSVFCALPESFSVSNTHDVEIPDGEQGGFEGQVASDLVAAQFSLNKYTETWSEVDNDSIVEIGAPTNFRVDPAESFPTELIRYFVTECRVDGKNDSDQDMSYVVNHGIDCFSPIVAAGHNTPQDLTFNMFAYGHSEEALQSNVLQCSVQLCVGDDCYSEYYNAKEECKAGYVPRLTQAPFSIPPTTDEPSTEGSGQE